MSNQNNTTLYVGVTSDLIKRVYEHKTKAVDGFTKKYNVDKLVYYEQYEDIEIAIAIKREKRLKKYKREQKDALIAKDNPNWTDLYAQILG